MMLQKYAFIDRDGTLIHEWGRDEHNIAYPPQTAEAIKFMNGAIKGLQKLQAKGYKLVLATNKAYLGTQRNPQATFDEVMKYFYAELARYDMMFDYTMICPHGPEDTCDCRKPKIGGLKQFLLERKGTVDLEHSIMFGDRQSDRKFASNLGARYQHIATNGRFTLPPSL